MDGHYYIHITWPLSRVAVEIEGFQKHSIPDLESDVPAFYVEEKWWNEKFKELKIR